MPLIDPKFLSDPEDVGAIIRGIQIIRNLLKTDKTKDFGAKFNNNIFPGRYKLVKN